MLKKEEASPHSKLEGLIYTNITSLQVVER